MGNRVGRSEPAARRAYGRAEEFGARSPTEPFRRCADDIEERRCADDIRERSHPTAWQRHNATSRIHGRALRQEVRLNEPRVCGPLADAKLPLGLRNPPWYLAGPTRSRAERRRPI